MHYIISCFSCEIKDSNYLHYTICIHSKVTADPTLELKSILKHEIWMKLDGPNQELGIKTNKIKIKDEVLEVVQRYNKHVYKKKDAF